jgi:hypothetical protein
MVRAEPRSLEARARAAYEWGRWRAGVLRAARVIPALAVFCALHSQPLAGTLAAGLLVAAMIVWSWRGGIWGRAVWPGVLAGALPAVTPACGGLLRHGCSGRPCLEVCLWSCAAAGLICSATLAVWVVRVRAEDRRTFVLAAGLLSAATAAVGCTLYGLVGVGFLTVAVLASGAPLLLAQPRRA